MATTASNVSTTVQPQSEKTSNDVVRRSVPYHPSVWGDYFLELSQDEKMLDLWKERAEVLKQTIMEKLRITDGVEKLELIDTIHHLGVSYNFEKEIEEALEMAYKTYDIDAPNDNLATLALRFRLLRQNGWNASSDVFEKFKEGKHGGFKGSIDFDVEGMLSLYEAANFGTNDEKILAEAVTFTTQYLKDALLHIDDSLLVEKVEHSLKLPLLKRIYRWEARRFISFYEKNNDHDKVLLEYAKLDFNILQYLHQTELKEVTKWWKEEALVEKMKFTRDRITEVYLWCSVHFEPQYSRARIYGTKIVSFAVVIDDFTDVYGTEDEFDPFLEALDRLYRGETESLLPDNMNPLYKAMSAFFVQIEDELAVTGHAYRVQYLKQALKDMCKAYCEDGKWYYKKYIPSLGEFWNVYEITASCSLVITALFSGAGENITKESMESLTSHSNYIQDVSHIIRILDDLGGYKFEQERGHMTSFIICYMKENNCREEEALEKAADYVRFKWREVNKACIRPTPLPMASMLGIKTLDCLMEELYELNLDGFVFAKYNWKNCMSALFKDTISI